MIFILIGPPGAGKGTQAAELVEDLKVAHISTGDILRQAIKDQTEVGLEAKSYMDAGELVPDDVVIRIIKGRVQESDCANGYLLDGFPRTVEQAEAMNDLFSDIGAKLDIVVNMVTGTEVVMKRLTGRRLCKSCGAGYHIPNIPPQKEGVCDKCDGKLYQRDDDKEDVIEQRLVAFNKQTEPVIAYYEKQGLLADVDGNKDVMDLKLDILALFKSKGI